MIKLLTSLYIHESLYFDESDLWVKKENFNLGVKMGNRALKPQVRIWQC